MVDKKKADKPKYEVPRNDIPPQTVKSHFSSDESSKVTFTATTPSSKKQQKTDDK